MGGARSRIVLATAAISAFVLLGSGQAFAVGPTEIDLISAGAGPAAIGAHPALGRVYVANATQGTVTIIDEVRGVIGTTAVGSSPQGIAVSTRLNRVYVALGTGKKIAVLNALNGSLATTFSVPQCTGTNGPWGIAVNQATDAVYVACYSAGVVVALDGSSGDVIAQHAAVAASGPLGLAVDPSTELLYVGYWGLAEIRVLNALTFQLVTTIRQGVSAGNWGLATDPSTHRVFASNYQLGTVSTIVGGRVVSTIGGFSGPEWISYDGGADRLWIPEFNAPRRVTALSASGIIMPVAIRGSNPTEVTVGTSGLAYSANYATGNVSVIAG